MANGISITPEVRAKMDRLLALTASGKINEWGTKFLKDVVTPDRKFLSPAQLNTIEKMYEQVVVGKKRAEDAVVILKTERLKACKQSCGWQIYVDQRAVGVSMTRIDAERILVWFEHSLESLEGALKASWLKAQKGDS